MLGRIPAAILAMLTLAAVMALPAQAATSLFPDMKTFAPRDLRFEHTDTSNELEGVPGPLHNTLRFTNTIFNNGEGKLEVTGTVDPVAKTPGTAFQRIYDDQGGSSTEAIGEFYWHQAHLHWHFDDWGSYQLWTKAEYDDWKARGGSEDEATRKGTKTTSCLMDEEFIEDLEHTQTPFPAVYPSGQCLPNATGLMTQGISPGWGDTYDYYRAEQWIDLGPATGGAALPDGTYVLRSVTDPKDKVFESPGKADDTRDGIAANAAIIEFNVQDGQILDGAAPSGTVAINDVDDTAPSRRVTVKAIGRDDVSGVDQVRLSNDGVHWSPPRDYRGTGSTPDSIAWDLNDVRYGGTPGNGTKTVYVQFHDASGKLSAPESDSIVLESAGPGGADYSAAVIEDAPVGYWRLGEAGGDVAANSAGAGGDGTYFNEPELGAASLVANETDTAARLPGGAEAHVSVPSSGALSPTAEVSVEAWIKPAELPASRPAPEENDFATIASKHGAYALQFNGSQLEFKVRNARAQAAGGAIEVGKIYHVLGTFDGAKVRLFVNGQQVAVTDLAGTVATSGGALGIGSWDGESEFFTGTIDDVAVYATALEANRVGAHYTAGKAPDPIPTVAAPSDLAAAAVSPSAIDLTWTDNSDNETEFVLERSTSPSFADAVAIPIVENAQEYTDQGLSAGTTYHYRLKAHNAASLTDSEWSQATSAKTLTPTTPPQPPKGGGSDGGKVPPQIVTPPLITPPTLVTPLSLSLAAGKRTIRVSRSGRLSYTFRATPGAAGAASFATTRAVRVSSRRKRRVTLVAKSFKVPASGKVVLRIKLSRKSLAILKRNRALSLNVKVAIFGTGGPKLAVKRLTLKAPRV